MSTIGATVYRMTWTDDRLQDRFDSIDKRFDQVDKRFDQVDKRFEQVDKRFDGVEQEVREMRSEMNQRLDGLQRTLVQGAIALSGAFVAGFAAMIVLISTQL